MPEPRPETHLPRRCRLGLLVLCFCLFLASTSGTFLGNQDTVFMWGVAWELAHAGDFAISPDALAIQPGQFGHLAGKDGRLYFPKGMSYSVVLVPFCWMGDALAGVLGDTEPRFRARDGMVAASAAGPLIAALEVLVVFELCLAAGLGLRRGALAAVGAGLGTILWAGSKSSFSEPFMGLLLTFQFLCLVRYARDRSLGWPALAGAAFAVLFLSQPAMLALAGPPLGGLLLWTVWRREGGAERWRSLLRMAVAFGVPVLAGLAVLAWLNHARYGSVTSTGYWQFAPRHIPLYQGVYGVFLSPGKSLFLYSPLLVLVPFGVRAWVRRVGAAALFPLLLLVLFLGLYGWLPTWHGDGAWGPRYFTPLTGGLAALAAGFLVREREGRRRELAWIALAALGAAVQVVGVTTSTPGYFALLITNGVLTTGDTGQEGWTPILYEPRFSPVVGRARMLASRVEAWRSGHSGTWTTRRPDGSPVTLDFESFDILDLLPARVWIEVPPPWRNRLLAAWTALLALGLGGGLLLRLGVARSEALLQRDLGGAPHVVGQEGERELDADEDRQGRQHHRAARRERPPLE
jgi:hypothetical protein